MAILSIIARILIGLGAGFVVSGGVVAFISIIGIIPLMAYQTKTAFAMIWYENAIIIGSILGSIFSMWQLRLPNWPIIIVPFFFAYGMFVGTLIIALAEVLDVLPILDRRIRIKKGITLLVLALAFGKLVGSLCYWLYPYFTQIITN